MHFHYDFLTYILHRQQIRANYSPFGNRKAWWGHNRGSSWLQLSRIESTLPKVFKDFPLVGLSPNQLPQGWEYAELRASSSNLCFTHNNWNTHGSLFHPYLLGSLCTMWHSWACPSWNFMPLASVTLSSPGSPITSMCLFFHYCLLRVVFPRATPSWWVYFSILLVSTTTY